MTKPATPSNLIPERPILVYPSLASTIGLEEATMLSILSEMCNTLPSATNNSYTWYMASQEQISVNMPFWQPVDVQRVATNLREQGILIMASAPYTSSLVLKFAFNQVPTQRTHTPTHQNTAQRQTPQGMNYIAPSWQPDANTLMLLAQKNIPEQFAREQVAEFINYWRERNEPQRAWGSKFHQHVVRLWRDFEAKQNASSRSTTIPKHWRPSEDAMEIMTKHAGIPQDFIEKEIPVFELYWREQGATSDNWNAKFRAQLHLKWERHRSASQHDTVPKRIPEDWQPSRDVFDALRMAEIEPSFAENLIKEFVIYWRDSNQVHNSWNTRFLKHVKKCWANRSMIRHDSEISTKELSLKDELTDQSWAD